MDTSGVGSFAGISPRNRRGTDSYLGTELDLGLTWTVAPGLALDLVGGYMWAGPALALAGVTPSPTSGFSARHPKDVQTVVARVRFSF